MTRRPFKPGDRVQNGAGAPATVIAATYEPRGWRLTIKYDGARFPIDRPADLFTRIPNGPQPQANPAA